MPVGVPPIVGAVLSGEQENGGSIRTEEVAEMADAKGTEKALKMALEDEGGRSMTEGSGGGSSRLRMR